MQCQPVLFFSSTARGRVRFDVVRARDELVLLSEACESDKSWRCLPSGLKTGAMRMK